MNAHAVTNTISGLVESLRRFVQDQPVSFLLFVLGAVLMLLGLSRGVVSIVAADSLRPYAIGLGALAVVASVVLALVVPRQSDAPEQRREHDGLADIKGELDTSQITSNQRRVLRAIEDTTEDRSVVSERRLGVELDTRSPELYYRLEQLRLLGFIEREVLNPDTVNLEYGYRFSRAYASRLGIGNEGPRPRPSAPSRGSQAASPTRPKPSPPD
jgi:hypothetical protein